MPVHPPLTTVTDSVTYRRIIYEYPTTAMLTRTLAHGNHGLSLHARKWQRRL